LQCGQAHRTRPDHAARVNGHCPRDRAHECRATGIAEMLLKNLREEVLEANLELVRRGLVLYTFGNASGISRKDGLVAIKPSGVPYDELAPEHIVITRLDGEIVEGDLRPSSDLATH